MLAKKLYSDYVKACGKFRGVEPESFAEDWIGKNIPDDDQPMMQYIWVRFVDLLIEHRRGKG